MSTLKVEVIQNLDGIQQYLAKAWVNFNGATITIRGSGNVSSITDNGVGDYTVNFTTAMPDVNYTTTGICRVEAGSGGRSIALSELSVPSTGSVRVINRQGNLSSNSDSDYINVVVFR